MSCSTQMVVSRDSKLISSIYLLYSSYRNISSPDSTQNSASRPSPQTLRRGQQQRESATSQISYFYSAHTFTFTTIIECTVLWLVNTILWVVTLDYQISGYFSTEELPTLCHETNLSGIYFLCVGMHEVILKL